MVRMITITRRMSCDEFTSSRADFWNEIGNFDKSCKDKIAVTVSYFQL